MDPPGRGFREGSEREGEGEKEGQLAHEHATRSSVSDAAPALSGA